MSLTMLLELALALAAAPGADLPIRGLPIRGLPIRLGDRVATSISPAGDEDRFAFDAAAGTKVTLDLKAKTGGLDPALLLFGPGGEPVVLGDRLRPIVLPETGRYVAVVRGRDGTAGAYELRTKGRAPRAVRIGPVSLAAGAHLEFPVWGVGDARWTVRVRAPRGCGLRVLAVLDPDGAEVVGALEAFGEGGAARRARVFLSGSFGSYRLRLGGGDTATDVRTVVRVKPPRVPRERIELGPVEPRPAAVSPEAGPAGTRVLVTGEGFAPGSEVRFGGVPGTYPELGAEGGLAATVPGGAPANVPLDVTVRNPDGQENVLPGAFTLVAPASVSLVVPDRAEPGDTVTVLGSRFEDGAEVLFDDRPSPAVSFVSGASVRAVIPATGLVEGPVDVTVALPGGGPRVTARDALVVEAEPVIRSVVPSAAVPGAEVRIVGDHFTSGTEVRLADLVAPDVGIAASGELTARVPEAGLPFGPVDVTVVKPFGGRATLAGGLTVVPDTSYKGLLITGVVDGPRGSLPKAVELYATADVPDLSVWALETANNGNPLAGPVFALSGSAEKGDYIHVASEAPGFTAYFGFAPAATTDAVLVNGNDVVALYLGSQLVDVYGRPSDVAGAADHGAAWDYMDSYAYRKDRTRPSVTFAERDWTIPGTDTLDAQGSGGKNGDAGITVPFGSYAP